MGTQDAHTDPTGEGDSVEESSRSDLPRVDEFAVEVQEEDGGHAVTVTADGERRTVQVHADPREAERMASHVEDSATRHEGAARVEEVPDAYPGKGEDETQG